MPIKRIFHYYWLEAKKYKWSLLFMFIVYGAGDVLSNIVNPLLYQRVVDTISGSTPSADLSGSLFHVAFLLLLVVLSYQALYRTGDYLIVYFEANVIREIHNSTFLRLMNHSYRFFSNNFSGSLVAKAKRFASSFERITDVVVLNIWFALVQLTGVFIVLFIQVPKVGLLLLVWVIVYIFITFVFVQRKFKYDLLQASADSKVTARLTDAITNSLNIKIFSGKNREDELFKGVTSDEYLKRTRAWYFGNFQITVQGFLMATLQVSALYLMISLWLKGTITAGTVVLVQIYMLGVFDQLWGLGRSMMNLFQSVGEAKEMADIFDQRPDILDAREPEECRIAAGKINFEKVDFEYSKGHKVFKDFNFEVRSGEKIGLVGHSGSGKTTIVKMLLRFGDVKAGEVLIDGQNIAKIRQDDLRDKISYVPQDPILFHRSIRENIAYSNSEAREEEIIDAARKAHAHEFIMALSKGYDTFVGERGVKLSGGERQRIAIARAMLKHAPILLLDEATSALDSISESYIQDAFAELMKGKTSIVIAHRLSTVQKMDRIVVLDHGKIVEEGDHGELLKKKGLYANLWDRQTGGFLK